MTSRNRRIVQAKSIKQRAKEPSPHGPTRCVIPNCRRDTQRSQGRGLSESYCKYHATRLRRHGHPTVSSYSNVQLSTYRKAVRKWLRLHRHEDNIRVTVQHLDSMMARQARSVDAYHQRFLTPQKKAENVIARLKEAQKSGLQLLEIVLTVKIANKELGPWGAPDFMLVQIGKLVKRLKGVSGTHFPETELGQYLSKYPRAEGLYLRHLGTMILERSERIITAENLREINDLRNFGNEPANRR